jgi:hypothetical protein
MAAEPRGVSLPGTHWCRPLARDTPLRFPRGVGLILALVYMSSHR